MHWTQGDLAQFAAQGTTPAEVERQIELFRHPPPPLELARPCRIGDGIRVLSQEEIAEAPRLCEEARRRGRLAKFVPASGAASRMFQSLLAARAAGAASTRAEAERRAAAGDADARAVLALVDNLPRFAFQPALRASLGAAGLDLAALVQRGDLEPILDHLLTPAGLDYAQLPKGLLHFHRYGEAARTPFEEHLIEAAGYVRDGNGGCRLHFTVSPEHGERFEALLEAVRANYEARFAASFRIDFSVQKGSTDTIAVDLRDEPFRSGAGTLVFRPGGHGALIENLNDFGGDIVLVKNVDNVVPEHLAGLTILWKQVLAAYLVRLEEQIHRHLSILEGPPHASALEEAASFARRELSLDLPVGGDFAARRERLVRRLDRPLRVCGVVENTGEPGGGPFWVRGADGYLSLQIIESAQVDQGDPGQRAIFGASTHFNPVDIVCGVRDRRGEPFDLRRFADPRAVFLSRKSSGGRELKALELPGLWNGAMADWNTVFVEVPLKTFNPVKTVLDLLRPEHQPEE
jgi:hypothetical protein